MNTLFHPHEIPCLTPNDLVTHDVTLEPFDNRRLANLCGQYDEHLRQIEKQFQVIIHNRGHQFQINGPTEAVQNVTHLLNRLYLVSGREVLSPAQVHLFSQQSYVETLASSQETTEVSIRTRKGIVRPKGINQTKYVEAILRNDINFGIGVAGSGKTYLAVACAVEALEREQVRRLVLVRPAVEAGERLGFLPGDLAQKVDPYLRPLYDALYEMLGFDRVAKLIDRHIIEIAPLAYMRGRTLNDAFIILDEAQNTTIEQMKMFLTRLGFGSTVVITGDITQIDLPRHIPSGLRQVINILKSVEGVSFTFFEAQDVVRHPIVARIIRAYQRAEQQSTGSQSNSQTREIPNPVSTDPLSPPITHSQGDNT